MMNDARATVRVKLWRIRVSDKAMLFQTMPPGDVGVEIWIPRSVIHHVSTLPAELGKPTPCLVDVEEWVRGEERFMNQDLEQLARTAICEAGYASTSYRAIFSALRSAVEPWEKKVKELEKCLAGAAHPSDVDGLQFRINQLEAQSAAMREAMTKARDMMTAMLPDDVDSDRLNPLTISNALTDCATLLSLTLGKSNAGKSLLEELRQKTEALDLLDSELELCEAQIASERLGGNVVKEEFWKGKRHGLLMVKCALNGGKP